MELCFENLKYTCNETVNFYDFVFLIVQPDEFRKMIIYLYILVNMINEILIRIHQLG